MVKIRLKRVGRKHLPVYSIVAADSRFPRDGRFNEKLGFYHPLKNDFKINESNLKKWVENGAVLTDSVQKVLNKHSEIKIDFNNLKEKPLSPAKSINKTLTSLIQKNVGSRLETSDDVVIDVSELYNSNPKFKRYMDLLEERNKEPKIGMRKLLKKLVKKIDDNSLNLGKLYTLDQLQKMHDIFSSEDLEKAKSILYKQEIEVTGALKNLKFELSDAKYREYMNKNRYLKDAKLPEKKQITLTQFLYNNNIERLFFDKLHKQPV